jgi:hypothetical protein
LAPFFKAVFTLAEFIARTLATATSDTHHCTCIELRDTDRIVSISCRIAQGGQGKNILCTLLSMSVTVADIFAKITLPM